MKTIGRHWPASAPRGDYQAECSYCGVTWRRSQLVRDASGNYACPDDYGRDRVTLDRGNARAARALARPRRPQFTGAFVDGLLRLTEEPVETVTYDDPQVRFGNRLAGWWQPTTAHCTVAGGAVTRINDQGPWGAHLNEEFAFPPRHTLETDATLDIEVLVAEGAFGFVADLLNVGAITRAVPFSWWMTAKLPPFQNRTTCGTAQAIGGDFVCSLRVDTASASARIASSPAALSTPQVVTEMLTWHVYGLTWLNDDTYHLTVDGASVAHVPAPAMSKVISVFYPVTGGRAGWRIAEVAAVSGSISADEALAQSRYMMQYAGLE